MNMPENKTTDTDNANQGMLPLDFNANNPSPVPAFRQGDQAKDDMPSTTSPINAAADAQTVTEAPKDIPPEVVPTTTDVTAETGDDDSAEATRREFHATPHSEQKIRKRPMPTTVKFTEHASVGRILLDARENSGLNIHEVEEATRIKAEFIEAIEHDDFQALPPPVYVRAYIRSLCALYDFSKELSEEIQHGIKQGMQNVVPEELIHQIERDKQINVDDEHKFKRMLTIVCASAVVLVLLTVGSIALIVMNRKAAAPRPAQPQSAVQSATFDPARLRDFSIPPLPELSRLPVPVPGKDTPQSQPRQ